MSTDLEVSITIAAPPETVFPYLVDQDRFVEWMGTSASLDPTPGGQFAVVCAGVNPGAGEFVEIVQDQKVRFTFGWDLPDHPIPAGSTEVEITLTPVPAGTLVRLFHRGLPEDAISDHRYGWTYYLARLDKVSVGIDPGPDRANEPNAVEQ
jgi:uncharacterized protein YndB with AHSA1/START domain